MPFDQWVSRFNPSRQTQLREGLIQAQRQGLSPSDAVMKVFIKTETSPKGTDPRNISPRQPQFLAVLGPHVASLEKAAARSPYLVKGLTPTERARKLAPFRRGAVIETDFSRFDMTVSADIITTVERMAFRQAYPKGLFPLFDEALHLLTSMVGIGTLGATYTVEGTRASGDAHTSIANGIINRFVIWACLRHLPCPWYSFHEGDDGVIFIDKPHAAQAVECLQFAFTLGFRLKCVVPNPMGSATFCGRYTCLDCGREHCDVIRTLTKFHISHRPGSAQSLVLAKAYSYASTDSHTPIVGPLCAALIHHLQPLVNIRTLRRRLNHLSWYERERAERGIGHTDFSVSPCCRASVAETASIDPVLQAAVEKQVSAWREGVTVVSPLEVLDYLVDGPQLVVYD
ncbi:hypothetical protein 2 [Wenling tombus-like virus 5]|uniref:hypothetical protein 2 n=1 Tax=Wenling tombus-like virus 5 TaxID=1923547 RepID=UPI00090BEE28|nr:hypothetical protein 2 [Wenling tombus-like virus 5]APG76595.1 hypothetical protein 2 [Wenling tombus-like virus 5]